MGYGNDAKFARVFRDTWPRLPLWARRAMLANWRTKSSPPLLCLPHIKVLDSWARRKKEVGIYFPAREEILFRAPAVDLMPDEILSVLISHELAHAASYAAALWFTNDGYKGTQDEEFATRDMNWGWGFEEDELDAWLHENNSAMQRHCRRGRKKK
jgi:hypothetical protein